MFVARRITSRESLTSSEFSRSAYASKVARRSHSMDARRCMAMSRTDLHSGTDYYMVAGAPLTMLYISTRTSYLGAPNLETSVGRFRNVARSRCRGAETISWAASVLEVLVVIREWPSHYYVCEVASREVASPSPESMSSSSASPPYGALAADRLTCFVDMCLTQGDVVDAVDDKIRCAEHKLRYKRKGFQIALRELNLRSFDDYYMSYEIVRSRCTDEIFRPPQPTKSRPSIILAPQETVCTRDACRGRCLKAVEHSVRILTSGGVRDGSSIRRTCSQCKTTYQYHTISVEPTTQERLASTTALSPTVQLRPYFLTQPYIGCRLDNGLYYVERALLEERHAFAERAAVSMDGFVTCILEKIRRSGEDHVWSPAHNVDRYFDSAYFTFELYRVCALLRGRGVSCDDPHTSIFLSHDSHLAESTEIDNEFNRVAILLKAEHFRRFCVGHRSSCPGGERCKWVVTDGQHGTGPAICDNIHLHHLIVDGVNAIPCARSTHRTAAASMASLRLFTILTLVCSAAPADGCRGKPGMRTNYCRQCVRLVAERTPHESEEPIYRDPGRADAAGAVVAEAFEDVATTEQDAGLAGGEGAGVQDALSEADDNSEAGGSR